VSNLSTIASYLAQMGLNKIAIAGILGNLNVESGFDPNAGNQREGAIGIAQWEGGRRRTLQQLASSMGRTENYLGVQLEMLRRELEGRNLVGALNSAGSAANAAAIFDEKFEVSAGTTRQQRVNYANQYFTTGKISGSGGGSSTGGGGQTQGQNFDSTTSATTAADYKSALGPLAGLLTGIPELKALLDKAISSDQPVNDFINSVEQSPWYRSHSETVRENIALQFSDPATYHANRVKADQHIQQLADQLGVRLSHDQLVNLTTQYTLGAWDDQTLQHALGSYYKRNETPTGQAAQFYQQLAQTYADYGVPYSNATLQYRVQQLVAGNTTADTYKQAAINSAKGLYPGLSQQLDQGLTVKDIADPYMQTMANMLEINPNTVKLTDPLVQKALQGQVVAEGGKATPTVTTLSQFQQQLRADPRWQYTQNSKDEMSTALMHVGGDFGFTEI
jgi:hypothetical protein